MKTGLSSSWMGKTVEQWRGKAQQGAFVIGPSESKLCPGDRRVEVTFSSFLDQHEWAAKKWGLVGQMD